MPIIAIALIIAAALGGGTAVAAQSSLPGDPLWGFKTEVNENIQGVFKADTAAKAQWDIELTQERLDEAKQLAASGKLDAEAQAKVKANFDLHASEVAKLIAELRAEGKTSDAAQVAARFQATLAQSAAGVTAAASTTAEASIASLLDDVRGTLDSAATLSADTSADAHAGSNTSAQASDSGSATTSTGTTGAGTTVHTGTSVRGGQGGIQTTADGTVVGI